MMINYLYELPSSGTRTTCAGKLLGGWQISGITQFQTGTTCSVVSNNDYAGVGVDGNLNDCGGTGEFWVMNGNPTVLGQIRRQAAAKRPAS